MIPSYGHSLIDNPSLTERVRAETASVLHIDNIMLNEKKSTSGETAA
jgi:hypothetical protein